VDSENHDDIYDRRLSYGFSNASIPLAISSISPFSLQILLFKEGFNQNDSIYMTTGRKWNSRIPGTEV
jgi:hypothetical protein